MSTPSICTALRRPLPLPPTASHQKLSPTPRAPPLSHCPPPPKNGPGAPRPRPISSSSQLPTSCFLPRGHRGDHTQGHECPGTTRRWISSDIITTTLSSSSHPISQNRPLLASQSFQGTIPRALSSVPSSLLFFPRPSPYTSPSTQPSDTHPRHLTHCLQDHNLKSVLSPICNNSPDHPISNGLPKV